MAVRRSNVTMGTETVVAFLNMQGRIFSLNSVFILINVSLSRLISACVSSSSISFIHSDKSAAHLIILFSSSSEN